MSVSIYNLIMIIIIVGRPNWFDKDLSRKYCIFWYQFLTYNFFSTLNVSKNLLLSKIHTSCQLHNLLSNSYLRWIHHTRLISLINLVFLFSIRNFGFYSFTVAKSLAKLTALICANSNQKIRSENFLESNTYMLDHCINNTYSSSNSNCLRP